jgi:AcrR family transcriptional regulator
MSAHDDPQTPKLPDARERVLESAYELFSRHGVRAVGVDAVITNAGVARMSLYRNFSSKDELAVEFLRLRGERWGRGWLQGSVEARAEGATARLLAIFDVFDEWFQEPDFVGCPIINVLLETPERDSPLNRVSAEILADVRAFVRSVAEDAGVPDPETFAAQWHILMKGSIVAGTEGDLAAARRAREVGELLLRTALPRTTA